MPGSIYIGYQGIGKSSLAGKHTGFIDLESSNFRLPGGYRPQEWYKYYVCCAYSLSSQGFDIFISSHKVVRDELHSQKKHDYLKSTARIFVVYPSLDLEDEWINKLHKRYLIDNSRKNHVAYLNALDRYSDNILEMKDDAWNYGFKEIEILSMDYNLRELIEKANCPEVPYKSIKDSIDLNKYTSEELFRVNLKDD